MKVINCLLVSFFFTVSFLTFAEEDTAQTPEENYTTAYISDDLFIYMHAGPGNNYRIVGSINSGDEVKITGEKENGYTKIVDSKKRITWIESKYVSTTPGLRVAIAELNSKLANIEDSNIQVENNLTDANSKVEEVNEKNANLISEITTLKKQLLETQSQLSNQDLDLKKEYFFNGAFVLAIGLLLGIILPRLSVRKKASMESWK